MSRSLISRLPPFGLLFGLLVATAFAGPGPSPAAASDQSLTGEAATDYLRSAGLWKMVQQAIQQQHYAAQTGDTGAIVLRNQAQALRARIDTAGFELNFRRADQALTSAWSLASVSFDDQNAAAFAPARLSAEGSRVELRYPELDLVEWFNNASGGLEHGFTIERAPLGRPTPTAIQLTLDVAGDLRPEADADGLGLTLQTADGTELLGYRNLSVWDATGRALTATLTTTGTRVTYHVDAANATYPITVDPTFVATQQAYLKAANAEAGDQFGYSVAIAGDTVVVGAFHESGDSFSTALSSNNNAPFAGAAYVFVRSGSVWSQQAYLKASNAGQSDQFGTSVAIAGDTVVVGAPREDGDDSSTAASPNNNADSAGAAYIFVRSGSTWSQQAYLKASNAGEGDEFGYSVAIAGDTVVVGAQFEDGDKSSTAASPNNDVSEAGAAYIFARSGSTWSQQAYLKAANAEEGDRFGVSVAIADDTVVVGAQAEDGDSTSTAESPNNNEVDAGAAYIFVRSGSAWSQQSYLKASNAEGGDTFGCSVAIAGDTVVVGARLEDGDRTSTALSSNNSASSAGAAYVFVRSGSTWSQQAYLKASNAVPLDYFGYSVAISGDTVAVGAYFADGDSASTAEASNYNAANSGSVFAFIRSGSTWFQQAYLKASNAAADDYFGISVAIAGNSVVAGAFSEDGDSTSTAESSNRNADGAGAAYVYLLGPTISSITAPNVGTYQVDDTLTFTVNMSADVTVTGTPRLPLTIGSQTVYATYDATNSTATALKFTYTIQSGEADFDGMAVASPLDLNGGAIVSTSDNADATLFFAASNSTEVLIDALPAEYTAHDSAELLLALTSTQVSTLNLVADTTYTYPGGTIGRSLTIHGNGATLQAGAGVTADVIRSGTADGITFALSDYLNVKVFLDVTGSLTIDHLTIQNNGADAAANGFFTVINVKNGGSLVADAITIQGFHNNPTPGTNLAFGIHTEPIAEKLTLTNSVIDASNALRNVIAARGGVLTLTGNTFTGTDHPDRLRNSDGYEYALYLYGGSGTVSGNTITGFDSTTQSGYASAALSAIGFYNLSFTIENNTLSGNSLGLDVTRTWTPYSTPTPTVTINGTQLDSALNAFTIGEALRTANNTESVSASLDQNDEVQLTPITGDPYFAVLGGYRSPLLTASSITRTSATLTLPENARDILASADSIELEMQQDDETTTWTDASAVASWSGTPHSAAALTLTANHTFRFRAKLTHTSYVENGDPTPRTLVTYSAPLTVDTALPPVITLITAPAAGYYGLGELLAFTVTTDVPVSITGTPRLAFKIGSTTRYATYTSDGSTDTSLKFVYTIQAGDNDTNGIELKSPLELNGGTITDPTNNLSATLTFTAPSTTSLLVDAAPPAAPSTPALTAASDSGNSAEDKVTNITAPTFTGSAESGATVRLYDTDGTTELGSAIATGGTWTITSTTLAEGVHSISARATDALGNTSVSSSTNSVTIDTTVLLGATTFTLPVGSPSIYSLDLVSPETQLRPISYVIDASLPAGLSLNATNGAITGTPTTEGTTTLNATITDAAGNTITESITFIIGPVDTTAPTILSMTVDGDPAPDAQEIAFKVIFSERVRNVNMSDFQINRVSGFAAGLVTRVEPNPDYTEFLVYAKILGNVYGQHTSQLQLALAPSLVDIIDLSGNALDQTATPVASEFASTLVDANDDGDLHQFYYPEDVSAAFPFQLNTGSIGLLFPGAITRFGKTQPARMDLRITGFTPNETFYPLEERDTENMHLLQYVADFYVLDPFSSQYNKIVTATGEIDAGCYAKIEEGSDQIHYQFKTVRFVSMQIPYSAVGTINTSSALFKLNLTASGSIIALNGSSMGRLTYPMSPLRVNEVKYKAGTTDEIEFIEFYDGGWGNTTTRGAYFPDSLTLSDSSLTPLNLVTNSDGYYVLGTSDTPNVSNPILDSVSATGNTVTLTYGRAYRVPIPIETIADLDPTALGSDYSLQRLPQSQPVLNDASQFKPGYPSPGSANSIYLTSRQMTQVENTTTTFNIDAFGGDPNNIEAGVSYAITGGADAELFTIDSTTGELALLTAPDYEAPADANSDNQYVVAVTAFRSTPLSDSEVREFIVTVTDVDDTAPDAPSTPDLATSSDTGSSSTDNLTRSALLTFTGTAEAGSTLTLFAGSANIGSTTVDALGDWTLTLTDPLVDGVHAITAKTTDAADNVSVASSALSLTIDTVAPEITSSLELTVAYGDTPSYTVTATGNPASYDSARLPVGLAINPTTGAMTGTVSGLGSGSGDIYAIDAAGNSAQANLSITAGPRALSVTGVTAASKTYDRTTAATLNTATAALSGKVGSDDVNLVSTGATGSFASAAAGTAKSVTVTGFTLTGAAAGNYTITQPDNLTANITTKALTLTDLIAHDKVYDGTTAATLEEYNATLIGVFNGDSVGLNVAGATATFASATVGTAKTVTVTGLTLSDEAASNYTLTQPIALTANITAATLTFTADDQSRRQFETNPALTYTVTGYVGNETAATAFTGTPELSTEAEPSSPVGTYPIKIAVGTLASTNYAFDFEPGTLTATSAHHAADTDQDWTLSLLELTRVIDLYNTRDGTVRTGAYRSQAETEDGFAPGPGPIEHHHSADTDQDGTLSLLELTRVIDLYNTRSGTTRTGAYHTADDTEDGYAPGPAQEP